MSEKIVDIDSIQKRIQDFLETIYIAEADRKVAEDLLYDAISATYAKPKLDRFGLGWRHKSSFLDIVQRPILGTLKHDDERNTQDGDGRHIVIEGENLEVMKIIEKGYFGKIKMVYMNPPFNIGGEFIFRDAPGYLDRYMSYLSSDDGKVEGISVDAGTGHSEWLSMMYSRLFLARNLLVSDGVIFVSIDDHEFHHLRMIMDEVFGEENFVANFVWEKRYSPPPDTKDVGYVHENILCYRRSDEFEAGLLPMTDEQTARYTNRDDDPKGPWKAADYTCRYTAQERPNLYYPVIQPLTGEARYPKKTRVWACSKAEHDKNVEEGRLWWGKDGANPVPAKKKYLFEIRQGAMPKTLLEHDVVGHTDEATKELREHIPNLKLSPKPTRLIKHLMNFANVENEDIVLDCNAGTGATGEAVFSLESEGKPAPCFILIEFPEKLSEYDGTLTQAMLERLKSCKNKYENSQTQFKSFALGPSNFKVWNGEINDFSSGGEQLDLYINHVKEGSKPEDILLEILLRAGLRLTIKVTEKIMSDKRVFSIDDGAILVCLEREVTAELIEDLADASPLQVICLDLAFSGNDELKANAVQTFKARAESQESEIVFKTV